MHMHVTLWNCSKCLLHSCCSGFSCAYVHKTVWIEMEIEIKFGKSNVMLLKFDLKIKHVCDYPGNVFEIELVTSKGRTQSHTHTHTDIQPIQTNRYAERNKVSGHRVNLSEKKVSNSHKIHFVVNWIFVLFLIPSPFISFKTFRLYRVYDRIIPLRTDLFLGDKTSTRALSEG